MQPQHRIEEMIVDLSFSTTRLARGEKSKLADWLGNDLLPALDRLFSQYVPGDQILRLGKLEFDLGRLDSHNYQEIIGERLIVALSQILEQQLLATDTHIIKPQAMLPPVIFPETSSSEAALQSSTTMLLDTQQPLAAEHLAANKNKLVLQQLFNYLHSGQVHAHRIDARTKLIDVQPQVIGAQDPPIGTQGQPTVPATNSINPGSNSAADKPNTHNQSTRKSKIAGVHEQLLAQVLGEQDIATLLRELPQRQALVQRLTKQFSEQYRVELLRQLAPRQIPMALALLDWLQVVQTSATNNDQKNIHNNTIAANNFHGAQENFRPIPWDILWEELLDVALSQPTLSETAWLRLLLGKLAARLAISEHELFTFFPLQNTVQWHSNNSASDALTFLVDSLSKVLKGTSSSSATASLTSTPGSPTISTAVADPLVPAAITPPTSQHKPELAAPVTNTKPQAIINSTDVSSEVVTGKDAIPVSDLITEVNPVTLSNGNQQVLIDPQQHLPAASAIPLDIASDQQLFELCLRLKSGSLPWAQVFGDAELLERLINSYIRLGQSVAAEHSTDFLGAITAHAAFTQHKNNYYLQVLQHLLANELIDLEAIIDGIDTQKDHSVVRNNATAKKAIDPFINNGREPKPISFAPDITVNEELNVPEKSGIESNIGTVTMMDELANAVLTGNSSLMSLQLNILEWQRLVAAVLGKKFSVTAIAITHFVTAVATSAKSVDSYRMLIAHLMRINTLDIEATTAALNLQSRQLTWQAISATPGFLQRIIHSYIEFFANPLHAGQASLLIPIETQATAIDNKIQFYQLLLNALFNTATFDPVKFASQLTSKDVERAIQGAIKNSGKIGSSDFSAGSEETDKTHREVTAELSIATDRIDEKISVQEKSGPDVIGSSAIMDKLAAELLIGNALLVSLQLDIPEWQQLVVAVLRKKFSVSVTAANHFISAVGYSLENATKATDSYRTLIARLVTINALDIEATITALKLQTRQLTWQAISITPDFLQRIVHSYIEFFSAPIHAGHTQLLVPIETQAAAIDNKNQFYQQLLDSLFHRMAFNTGKFASELTSKDVEAAIQDSIKNSGNKTGLTDSVVDIVNNSVSAPAFNSVKNSQDISPAIDKTIYEVLDNSGSDQAYLPEYNVINVGDVLEKFADELLTGKTLPAQLELSPSKWQQLIIIVIKRKHRIANTVINSLASVLSNPLIDLVVNNYRETIARIISLDALDVEAIVTAMKLKMRLITWQTVMENPEFLRRILLGYIEFTGQLATESGSKLIVALQTTIAVNNSLVYRKLLSQLFSNDTIDIEQFCDQLSNKEFAKTITTQSGHLDNNAQISTLHANTIDRAAKEPISSAALAHSHSSGTNGVDIDEQELGDIDKTYSAEAIPDLVRQLLAGKFSPSTLELSTYDWQQLIVVLMQFKYSSSVDEARNFIAAIKYANTDSPAAVVSYQQLTAMLITLDALDTEAIVIAFKLQTQHLTWQEVSTEPDFLQRILRSYIEFNGNISVENRRDFVAAIEVQAKMSAYPTEFYQQILNRLFSNGAFDLEEIHDSLVNQKKIIGATPAAENSKTAITADAFNSESNSGNTEPNSDQSNNLSAGVTTGLSAGLSTRQQNSSDETYIDIPSVEPDVLSGLHPNENIDQPAFSKLDSDKSKTDQSVADKQNTDSAETRFTAPSLVLADALVSRHLSLADLPARTREFSDADWSLLLSRVFQHTQIETMASEMREAIAQFALHARNKSNYYIQIVAALLAEHSIDLEAFAARDAASVVVDQVVQSQTFSQSGITGQDKMTHKNQPATDVAESNSVDESLQENVIQAQIPTAGVIPNAMIFTTDSKDVPFGKISLAQLLAQENPGHEQLLILQQQLNTLLYKSTASLTAEWLQALTNPEFCARLIRAVPSHLLHQLCNHLQPDLFAPLEQIVKLVSDALNLLVPQIDQLELKQVKWEFIFQQLFAGSAPTDDRAQLTHECCLHLAMHIRFDDVEQLIQLAQRRLVLLKPVAQLKPAMSLKDLGLGPATGDASKGENWAAGLSISNAGQVLVAPFLPRLFSMLNLTQEGKFIHLGAADRAAHLVQFIVNGQMETPEYELPLNKILCGISTSLPISAGITVTEQEQTLIEQMLNSMIQHWKVLGSTSIAGLRETFLQRQGWLVLEEDCWRLKVQERTFDMLLDHLPWSIALIKHGWMDKPLRVTWRNHS